MKRGFLLGLLAAMIAFSSIAQVNEYKAKFIASYFRYIGWPDDTKSGDFIVGVLKSNEIYNELVKIAGGQNVGAQKITVKLYNDISEIENCQLLFVSGAINFNKYASEILSKLGGKGSLVISEREGALDNGAVINFVIRDDKLKYELSKANAVKYGLQINSRLESMASAVR